MLQTKGNTIRSETSTIHILEWIKKTAARRLMEKLTGHVIKSCGETDNKVLDVATGMSHLILPLTKKASEDLRIIGTDIDEKPLRGAMHKAKRGKTYHKISRWL